MKIAVLISFSGQGGVERMVMNLVREMAKTPNVLIDLLLIRASGPHLVNIPDNVNVIRLKAKHTLTAIPEIARYLKQSKPLSMLAAKDRAGRAAVRARSLAGVDTRIAIRLGTNLSTALATKNGVQKWLRVNPMQRIYRKVDTVVGVSEGVREDTINLAGIARANTTVIRNPVVTEQMLKASTEEAPHAWLKDTSIPVIMGIGRLSYQKNFHSLIEAFAALNKQHSARLIILGDGKDEQALKALADTLDISDQVLFAGFQANPYNWLANADLFVLSSRWEGSPNVLTEALALGVPCVSTRCPSGPNEVFNEGEYGPLVDVENTQQLSEAMLAVLQNPLPSETLKQAVVEYTPEISAKNYLGVLGVL